MYFTLRFLIIVYLSYYNHFIVNKIIDISIVRITVFTYYHKNKQLNTIILTELNLNYNNIEYIDDVSFRLS